MSLLTPWFTGDIMPVRVGLYRTRFVCDGWSYWRGDGWGPQMPTRIGAVQQRFVAGALWKEWRGMAQRMTT